MEVKKDLSDIWKEEDSNFLNSTKEAWWGSALWAVAWKRVPLTARPMTHAEGGIIFIIGGSNDKCCLGAWIQYWLYRTMRVL
jgi:hypothetical protein